MNIVLVMDRIENALLNTFLGMGTVFVVLVIIIFFISLLGFIPKLKLVMNSKKDENKSNKDEENDIVTQNNSEVDINKGQKNDILRTNEDNLTNDKELVAAIIAAITAYLGDEAPKDGLVVRSIKRANVENWKRS